MAVFIVVVPQPSNAASGGRIGGGNFRAPTVPRSGSYRGGYGGYGGYRGGGIGFPFILPFFGFGGGGLFGFLILKEVLPDNFILSAFLILLGIFICRSNKVIKNL